MFFANHSRDFTDFNGDYIQICREYIHHLSGCRCAWFPGMGNSRYSLSQSTWLFLARLGEVGDTCVWAHEDITGVQISLQKTLLGFADMDPSQRRLWKGVGWDKCEAVKANLVDAINGLDKKKSYNFI